jgi:hypothetical protein
MWLNESGITNIVPLEIISKIWQIIYNSEGWMNASHFVIHTDQGNIKRKKNKKGMPYINLKGFDREVALNFVQMVWGNMEGFTWRKIKEAREACQAQGRMIGMVRANYIQNGAITNANQIFGLDLA